MRVGREVGRASPALGAGRGDRAEALALQLLHGAPLLVGGDEQAEAPSRRRGESLQVSACGATVSCPAQPPSRMTPPRCRRATRPSRARARAPSSRPTMSSCPPLLVGSRPRIVLGSRMWARRRASGPGWPGGGLGRGAVTECRRWPGWSPPSSGGGAAGVAVALGAVSRGEPARVGRSSATAGQARTTTRRTVAARTAYAAACSSLLVDPNPCPTRRHAARPGADGSLPGDDHPAPIPVVLDVDTGVDDACALLLAAAAPRAGPARGLLRRRQRPVDDVVRNTLAVLEAAGRTDVPVARGAAPPAARDARRRAPRARRRRHGRPGLAGARGATRTRVTPSSCCATYAVRRQRRDARLRSSRSHR